MHFIKVTDFKNKGKKFFLGADSIIYMERVKGKEFTDIRCGEMFYQVVEAPEQITGIYPENTEPKPLEIGGVLSTPEITDEEADKMVEAQETNGAASLEDSSDSEEI